MKRKIIRIDEAKCNGCGACAAACHEGAIGMVDGKAKLLREDYCDGLGDCLPACPTGAITFEEREAPAYDEAAVLAAKIAKHTTLPSGCPGSQSRTLRPSGGCPGSQAKTFSKEAPVPSGTRSVSWLRQWPVQIKLVPVNAPYFRGADLLIAADCTAYAYGNFHEEFIRGRVTLIGCPKLDEGDYAEKLTRIFAANDIRTVTVTRMEVPCCGGIENAVRRAIAMCGKDIPLNVVTISADGRIL
ncbi:MAG: 4Fe-4S binding protein [Oscillospiraceae bacterium]|nr:4Fe-4S binding protein [Oscillospiraceae bacterium]